MRLTAKSIYTIIEILNEMGSFHTNRIAVLTVYVIQEQ